MYKERVKAGTNPIWLLLLWGAGIYALTLLWGIFQILAEVDIPYVMQFFLFAITIGFGWYIVSKFLTEFEITVSPRYITVTRFLGRRTNQVCTIRSTDIVLITDVKSELKKYRIKKTENFIRAFQKGNAIYIVYTKNQKYHLAKMKLSGMDSQKTSDKLKKEGTV